MSTTEYNDLLFEISQRLDELNVLDRLLFMCREKVPSGSEGNIHDALSLFKELEEQNNLGPDRIRLMIQLLRGVSEWSLLGKVKKFEGKRKEYKALLEKIIPVLDELNDLERLIAICRGNIREESEGIIEDVRSLFKELESQDNLGIDSLDIVKEILAETDKNDVLKEVEDFEERRNQEDEFEAKKAQRAALVSSLRNTLIGVVNMKTVFKVVAGGITVVSVLEVMSRWSSFDQLVAAVNSCVLPAGTSLVQITDGCVCLTVQAQTLSGLTALWNLYQDGTLQRRLYDFFVTDEVRERAEGEDVEVSVTIEEEEYQRACLELINEAQDYETFEGRRTDEGYKQPEMFEQHKPKLMDPRKFAFVQKYLEDHQETLSITTEVSDSALGTQATASEVGTEEISEIDKMYVKDLSKGVIRELDAKITLDSAVLENISRFFGVQFPGYSHYPYESILGSFPGTTVGVLKECFDALQLYDLLDLLERGRPLSLRRALSPEEAGKLLDNRPTKYHTNVTVLVVNDSAKGDSAEKIEAFFKCLNSQNEVTVITPTFSQGSRELVRKINRIRKMENSFKVQEERLKHRLEIELPMKRDLLSSNKTQMERNGKQDSETTRFKSKKRAPRHSLDYQLYALDQETVHISHELDELRIRIEELREQQIKTVGFEQIEKLEAQENERAKTALSTAMEKWIRYQDKFTLMAVFVITDEFSIYDHAALRECVGEKLALIPNHTKLVVGPDEWGSIREFPETVYAAIESKSLLTSMIEIFNKRWEKLDLISMMQEFHRIEVLNRFGRSQFKGDKLSTLPRFQKMAEGST